MIVYSVGSRASFDASVEFKKEVLHNRVHADMPILLVGNKSDKVAEREVSMLEGQQKATSWGASFIETSAKLSANVDEAFFCIARQALAFRASHAEDAQGKEKCVVC